MNFKIIKAEIRTIPLTAKTNAGDEYIYATVKLWTPVPLGDQPHRITMFMEPEEIEIWRDLIDAANGKLLSVDYHADYIIVNDLPSFRTKSSDGKIGEEIRNSMRILARINPATGAPITDPRATAMRMVNELMEVVVNNSAPVHINATVVNAPVVAPAELTAEEQLAALQAKIAAENNLG